MIKAHELIIKDEKLEDSVKSAELAYTKAMEAYNRSAVLYAGDALKKADDAIAEADLLYAEKLSPENFTQAKDFYNSANEKFESKDYVMSHLQKRLTKKHLRQKMSPLITNINCSQRSKRSTLYYPELKNMITWNMLLKDIIWQRTKLSLQHRIIIAII